MDIKIETDLIPNVSGVPHSEDNWDSPKADKMNKAYRYLKELDIEGVLHLNYDSESESFEVDYSSSKNLTKDQISKIMESLHQNL